MAGTHVTLSGSERPRKSDATLVGDVDPGSEVEVTVTVRGPALPHLKAGQSISRDELERSYAASPADLDKVTAELERYGLKVVEASALTRSLRVRGTAKQMEAAFEAQLAVYRTADQGAFRGREGELAIPSDLEGLVTGVLGLDQRRVARRQPGIPEKGDPAASGRPRARPGRPRAALRVPQRPGRASDGCDRRVRRRVFP